MRPIWTKELCQIEALKYTSKKEFKINSKNAYHGAHRHHWMDEICGHMITLGNRFNRALYAFEFSDNSVYVGLTFNLEKRKSQHLSTTRSAVYKHIEKTKINPEFKKLTDYTLVGKAQILEEYYINLYKSNGWILLNKAKSGSLGGDIIKWDHQNCKSEALRYEDRTSFSKNSPGAYKSASIYGWLDIYDHMEIKMKKKYWTKELCEIESKKYKTRNQFKKNSCDAYSYAYRNNLLDDICGHMKRYNNNFLLINKIKK